MKPTSWNTVLVGIGAILVLSLASMPIQNAEALDSTVLYNLQSIQNDIASLKENSQNFDADKIGSQAFNFKAVGESLLEIQTSQNLDDRETISKVLDYLITEYEAAFNEYKTQVDEYERQNSIDMHQKYVIKEMAQNFIDFKTADEDYTKLVNHNMFIQSEIKRLESEEQFQKYINKVAIKIVDANNGNKVQKIYHEVALEQIAEEENWELVAPAMDRIINQFSSLEIKNHLEMYKEKVLDSIEQLKRTQQNQPEILALTNDDDVKVTILDIILSENNEILTPSILSAQLKDEIHSIIDDSQKIVEDETTKIQSQLEAQRLDSQEEDEQDSIRKKISAQSEPEPEPQNNGVGNTDNNPSENANDNAKDKSNNEPSEKADDNSNDGAKENPKKTDNGKDKKS